MNKHTLYYNLLDAFAEGRPARTGCPICRLSSQAVDRYLGHLLYESVNDLDVRRGIRRSQGFCSHHAWQLQQKGDALGIAIIHQDVIKNIVRALRRRRRPGPGPLSARWLRSLLPGAVSEFAQRLAKELAPRGECPACRQRVEVEDAYLQTLLQHAADPELLALWRDSDGVCWPHFQRALQLVQDEAALRVLTDMELAHFGRLCDELGEFIRLHDHRLGGKGFGSERDSWIRAIGTVSGWHSEC